MVDDFDWHHLPVKMDLVTLGYVVTQGKTFTSLKESSKEDRGLLRVRSPSLCAHGGIYAFYLRYSRLNHYPNHFCLKINCSYAGS